MSRCIHQKCCLNKYLSTMLNLRRACEVVARGQNFLIKISSQLGTKTWLKSGGITSYWNMFPFLSKLADVNLTAKLLIVGLETYRVGAYCNNIHKFITWCSNPISQFYIAHKLNRLKYHVNTKPIKLYNFWMSKIFL